VATLAWIERQIAERDRRVERTPEMKRTELFKLYNDIMGGIIILRAYVVSKTSPLKSGDPKGINARRKNTR